MSKMEFNIENKFLGYYKNGELNIKYQEIQSMEVNKRKMRNLSGLEIFLCCFCVFFY